MRKMFTSMGLCAIILTAATLPAQAQTQTYTNQQKATAAGVAVKEVFKQVSQISGVDLVSFTKPDIKTIIASPLFGTQSQLRAAKATAISVQPDSMNMDLSSVSDDPTLQSLLKDVKLVFGNYKTYGVTTPEGRPVEVNIPQKIDISLAGMPLTLNFKIGEQTGLLPFSSLDVTIECELFILIGITDKDLISLKENATTPGAYTYHITLGKALRALMALTGEDSSKLPNYDINMDVSKMATAGTVQASLYALVTNPVTAKLPMGDALLHLNRLTASPDSVILTSYKEGTIQVDGYQKMTYRMKVNANNKGMLTTIADSTSTDKKSWKGESETFINSTSHLVLDPKDIMSSIFNNLIKDLVQAKPIESFTVEVTEKEADETVATPVLFAKVNTSISGALQSQQGNIDLNMYNSKTDDTRNMGIHIVLPLKGNLITAEFLSADDDAEVSLGKLYIKSNAMHVVTGNEATPALDEVKIYAQEGGIFVENADNATYQVCDFNGRFIANGRIAGTNEYINLPALANSNLYIVQIIKGNAAKAFKFKAK